MGASNSHPHCRVWADEHVPNESEKDARAQSGYQDELSFCCVSTFSWRRARTNAWLRSTLVSKFMMGYEMLAMPQRDIALEQAASGMRELTDGDLIGKQSGVRE